MELETAHVGVGADVSLPAARVRFARVRRCLAFGAVLGVLVAASHASAEGFGPLAMTNLQGEKVSLDEFRGKIVVLNFWATWCKPCVDEMPVLAGMSERFHRRGLRVVAASVDDPESHGSVKLLADRLPKEMEVWVGATIADMLRLEVGDSLPVTLLLDREGNVTHVHHGAIAANSFDDSIRDLLDGDRDRAGFTEAAAKSGTGTNFRNGNSYLSWISQAGRSL